MLKVVIDNSKLSKAFRRRESREEPRATEASRLHAVESQPEIFGQLSAAAEPALFDLPPEMAEESSAFEIPSKGAVRGIASLAVKQHYTRVRKTDWGKMVHAYCCGMVGHDRKGREVEKYVIETLDRVIAEWRKGNLSMDRDEVKAALARKAVLALDEIEGCLCDLIKTQGHPPKASSNHPAYKVVMIHLGFKTKRKVFVLFRATRVVVGTKKAKTRLGSPKYKYETEIEIVSVKSARDFRRSVGSRFSKKERNIRKQDEKLRRNRHVSERWEFRRTA